MRPRPPTRRASFGGRVYIHQPVGTTGPGPGSPKRLNYVQDQHHVLIAQHRRTLPDGTKAGRAPMNRMLPHQTLVNVLRDIHQEPARVRMRAHSKWSARHRNLFGLVRSWMNAGLDVDKGTVLRNLCRLSETEANEARLSKTGIHINLVKPEYLGKVGYDEEAHDFFSTLRVPAFRTGIRATFSLNPVQFVRNLSTAARMRRMVREATFMAYLKTGNLRFAKQVYGDMLDSTRYKNQAGVTARDFLMKHAGRADTTFQKIYESIKYRPAHQLQAAAVGFTSGHDRGNQPDPKLQSEQTQAERRRQQNHGDGKYDIKDDGKYDIKDDVISYDEADSMSENNLSLALTPPERSDSTTPKHNSGWHKDLDDGRKDRNSLSGRGSVPYGKLEADDLSSSNLERTDKVK